MNTLFNCIFLLLLAPCIFAINASSQVATANNWQELSPEICPFDSNDDYGLRALIFPPKHEIIQLPQEPKTKLEIKLTPEGIDSEGNFFPETFGYREVPAAKPLETRRQLSNMQQIGFLNAQDVLVDVEGIPMASESEVTHFSTAVSVEFSNQESKRIIWQRPLKQEANARIKASDNCTYAIESGQEVEALILEAHDNGRYICRDEGGYQLLAAQIDSRIETRRVVLSPGSPSYWMKGYAGEITQGYVGDGSHILATMLANNNKNCDWKSMP